MQRAIMPPPPPREEYKFRTITALRGLTGVTAVWFGYQFYFDVSRACNRTAAFSRARHLMLRCAVCLQHDEVIDSAVIEAQVSGAVIEAQNRSSKGDN